MDSELFTLSLYREVKFSFSRSAGAGGQNINKVSTKVTASVAVDKLEGLTAEERDLLHVRLARRISREGLLSVSAQDTRSQSLNRDLALQRLENLLLNARHIHARRKATRPTGISRRVRLENKKRQARKKANRKQPPADE
jgi:ribosome-associated protein